MADNESTQEEILSIFRESGALLEGHFLLRSGLHSGHFFQCARVCERLDMVTRLAELLLERIDSGSFDTVVAPAMGGLVLGQEVARQAGARFLFVEKVDDKLALRRNFVIKPGEKILIVEDVITRGGRVREALDIVKANEGNCTGVAVLVDRSEGKTSFEVPLTSLVEFSFPTYEADKLPPELAGTPAVKPGS
ncbi:orotate phosphoribosyltransferase [Rubellicoccus peritrichatus]|uniref:Orotate phosphoribosyltransferase n=1 Tax=Rubellicoccus peritrichatus TaxID=3080537 RepID=A0AAQ3LB54_9BACT|nr:orotate phosphoribosyltransferase [Puniceicoccus sp. CR14]WOO42057.1 orotate phosphoribosyltransferase [Puniceicoccus sp. CR14]